MSRQKSFTDEIRNAIETSGVTRYAISKATGVPESALTRFMGGGGGVSMRSLDKIAKHLGLHVTTKKGR